MFLHNITYNSNYNESLRDNAQLILLTPKNDFPGLHKYICRVKRLRLKDVNNYSSHVSLLECRYARTIRYASIFLFSFLFFFRSFSLFPETGYF